MAFMSQEDTAYGIRRLSKVIESSEDLHRQRRGFSHTAIGAVRGTFRKYITIAEDDNSPTKDVRYAAVDGTCELIEGRTSARLFAGGFAISGNQRGTMRFEEPVHRNACTVLTLPYRVLRDSNEWETVKPQALLNQIMLLSELTVSLRIIEEWQPQVFLLDRPLCGTMANTTNQLPPGSALRGLGFQPVAFSPETGQEIPKETHAAFRGYTDRLFRSDDPDPLNVEGRHLSAEDLRFLSRVGLELLIHDAAARDTLLCGVVKDTGDASFIRFASSAEFCAGRPNDNLFGLLEFADDIHVVETLATPWRVPVFTVEYDTSIMTEFLGRGGKVTKSAGYAPPGRFLRSYMCFGSVSDGAFAFGVERALPFDELLERYEHDEFRVGYHSAAASESVRCFQVLRSLCGGPFIEALFYPTPLALADRYASSYHDFVAPRLRASRTLSGRDWSPNEMKESFAR